MDDKLVIAIGAMGTFIVLVWKFGAEIVKLVFGSYVRTAEANQKLFTEHITEQTGMLRDIRAAGYQHDEKNGKAHLEAAKILERLVKQGAGSPAERKRK